MAQKIESPDSRLTNRNYFFDAEFYFDDESTGHLRFLLPSIRKIKIIGCCG
jgi:hypothetical protein